MLDQIKKRAASARLTEEAIYAQVLREIEAGIRRDGLYAKALTETNGDTASIQAAYIRLRVQSIRDEIELANAHASAQAEANSQQLLEREEEAARKNLHKVAERKAYIKKARDELFIKYEEKNSIKILRNLVAATAFIYSFLTIGMMIQLIAGNNVNRILIALFLFGAIASFYAASKLSPTHALVKCPGCSTTNRISAYKLMNCHCGKCGQEFEIQT